MPEGAKPPASDPAAIDDLFAWGPPRRLPALVRLPAPICPNHPSRAALVLAVGWLPLAVLATVAAALGAPDAIGSFARDIAVHARLAIAAPLFVLAYAVCARRLGGVARHFLASGLFREEDLGRLTETVGRARALVNAPWAEVGTLVLAYGIVVAVFACLPASLGSSAWQVSADGRSFSLAGWWHILVSLPLLCALIIGWLWRIAVWAWLLRRISRFDLLLVAPHPDHAAGLGFLSQSVRAFAPLGLAFGTIAAARFFNLHLGTADSRIQDGLLAGGTVCLVLLLSVGPLMAFSAPLFQVWRDGTFAYGKLASEFGHHFERKWFAPHATRDNVLSAPDFSAGADLFGVVANVYAIRYIPVDLRSVLMLIVVTLAPFIPAMFLSMPTDLVIQELVGLLV